MEAFLMSILVAVIMYLAIGLILALFEKFQSDDPIRWRLVFGWPILFIF